MRYRSRISILLLIFLFGVFFFPMLDGKDLLVKSIVIGIVYIFTMLICLLIFSKITYTIMGCRLIIRMLESNMAIIDIARIKAIKRSYNPLSSPAASLKRLKVKFYNKGRLETALISPKRESEFLEKLKEINPNIEIQVVQKQNILRFWDWDI